MAVRHPRTTLYPYPTLFRSMRPMAPVVKESEPMKAVLLEVEKAEPRLRGVRAAAALLFPSSAELRPALQCRRHPRCRLLHDRTTDAMQGRGEGEGEEPGPGR